MGITITDLKKNLGPGLGLRKNKYLLELPVPGISGETLNILCQSAGLPEKTIQTTTIWHKGRRYEMRGETNFSGTYEVSILDDSDMNVRKVFDKWLNKIDDTGAANGGILGASGEGPLSSAISNIKSGVKALNEAKNFLKNPVKNLIGFGLNVLNSDGAGNPPGYQVDVNIWQLSQTGEKVYGYKLQNAYPKELGIVTLDDEQENQLSQFSVTFAYSEFIYMEGGSFKTQVAKGLLGNDLMEIKDGIKSLFD